MKRQIRIGVFETNSSSTHSLIIVSKEEYKRFRNGEFYYSDWDEKLITKEKFEKDLKGLKDRWLNDHPNSNEDDFWKNMEYEVLAQIGQTYEQFFDDEYLESFMEEYKTKSGDEIVIFGKHGAN